MNWKVKKTVAVALVLLGSGLGTFAYAQNQMIPCPILTADDVKNVIDNGTISTNQSYTLADEAGKTRAQVLIDEPTANPFDTYYDFQGEKQVLGQNYLILVGPVLGKASYEAKERAKKILLTNEKIFNGIYDSSNKTCMYKGVLASPSTPNYPFKSSYESVVLVAVLYNEEKTPRPFKKKYHA